MDFEIDFNFNKCDVISKNICTCCGNEDFKTISRVSSHTENKYLVYLETSICKRCTHIQRTKILSQDWMLKMFQFRDDEQVKYNFNPINEKVEQRRYERYMEIGKEIKLELKDIDSNNINILDIGCGPGSGIEAWIDLGLNAKGVEPDISRAKYGIKKGLNISTSRWEEYDLNSFPANVYTSTQSLEHFYNADSFIESLSQNINDQALLYIEVPDGENFVTDWNDSLYLAHVHNFSENSLNKLLKDKGFKSCKRIFPYNDIERKKNNICILAKKEENYWDNCIKSWNEKKIEEYINKKLFDYNYLLPNEIDKNNMVNFEIPKINDLSLSYRTYDTVASTVKDNEKGRNLNLISQNKIRID